MVALEHVLFVYIHTLFARVDLIPDEEYAPGRQLLDQ